MVFTFGITTNTQAERPADVAGLTLKKQEFVKTVKEEFNIASDGQFTLKNKYGDVNINTWSDNKIKIEVTITVKAGTEKAAKEVFDRINIDFSNSNNYVTAETNIEDKKSKGWSWWSSSSSYEFSIDYEVFMPKTNNLDLYNKYGHSYVGALHGAAKVSVKYGDIRMEEVQNDLDLSVGYGNGTIIKANNSDVVLSYGKLRFKNAADLDMETKYSKIYIDEAADVKCASKYDTYEIGQIKSFRNQGKYDNIEITSVETIDVLAKYSDFDIRTIKKRADFDMQYGGMAVETLGSDFSEVQLLGKYTEFKINVTPGTNFKLDAVTQYAGVRYPSTMQVVYEKEKGNSHEVEGYMGGDRSTPKLIKARLSYGGIKVRN